MRLLIVIVVTITVAILSPALYQAAASPSHPHKVRYCDAPCTVVLPPNTLEDEFDFDYGWKKLSDWDGRMRWYPVVHVWKKHP